MGETNDDWGRDEVYEGRGMWVPHGMTAAEIVEGGRAISDKYDIDQYTARSIVITVLSAIRPLGRP